MTGRSFRYRVLQTIILVGVPVFLLELIVFGIEYRNFPYLGLEGVLFRVAIEALYALSVALTFALGVQGLLSLRSHFRTRQKDKRDSPSRQNQDGRGVTRLL
jgi:hypothetical protein